MANSVRFDHDLHCLVFSTNVDSKLKAARLAFVLEKTDGLVSWNLDMEDCEHVLRIDFFNLSLLKYLNRNFFLLVLR